MNTRHYFKTLLCTAGMLAASLLAGCGGGEQGRDPILGVPAADLVSVAVTPAASTVVAGTTQQYTAVAAYSDGSTVDVTTKAAWTSATPATATVGAATGLATGLRAGTVAISAAFAGKSGSAPLTVTAATVASLTLSPAVTTFQVGASRQLATVATYTDGQVVDVTATANYLSATPAAVKISNSGVITGVAAGSSALTASFGGKTASATATTSTALLSSIAVSPLSATVAVGATKQFIAVATYSDNSTAIITNSAVWSSSNGNALVSNAGLATGVSPGTSNITATSAGQSGSAVLTVTATAPPPSTPVGLDLRSAANFAVLAGTSLTNNSGGTTLINGDVGSPSQTVAPTLVAGSTDYQSGAILDKGLSDLQLAITDANALPCDVSFAGDIDLGGLTLPPGVYCYAGTISVTGTLTLNGGGDYVFRTALTLNSTANSVVALIGGADAEHVFWVPVGASTLGANSVFKGSILGKSAAITVGDNTTLLNGRVLSGAAVTLRNNQIAK